MTLNAGSAEVVIRIGEYERQTEHVKTQDELDRESRYMYSWSRRWDYVPTGLLCLRLYSRLGTPTRLVETATKPLHEFIPRVIHLVQLATQKEIDLETARRERERREAERQAAAHELARRREHYGRWEKALLDGRESWERAQRLREFVHELERRSGAESSDFVAWALDYIDHLDPVESFAPPAGGPPDLTHAEEQRLRDRTAPSLSDPWRR